MALPASSATASKFCRVSPLFVVFVALSSALVAFVPTAAARSAGTVEIGSGTLDRDLVDGPRRIRLNFDPLLSGTHTIRVAWDSDADIQFSIFQLFDAPKPDDRARIGTTSSTSTPAEWRGTLDISEQYFLSVWSAAGSGNFVATIGADAVDSTPLEIATQPTDLSVTEGGNAIFTVAATGSGALAYQWLADGAAIPGATDDHGRFWRLGHCGL